MRSPRYWTFAKSSLAMFLLAIVNLTTVRRVQALAAVLTLSAIFLSVEAVQAYNRKMEGIAESQPRRSPVGRPSTEWDS